MIEVTLKKAMGGDKKAENEIFQKLSVSFRLIAGHKIKDRNIAEEIAQKACITVLEKYKNESFSVSFEAWAYGVLRMHMRNYFSSHTASKARIIPQDDLDIKVHSDHPVESDLEERLLTCLGKILRTNLNYARALNLVYQGYKTEEICDKLNINRDYLYVILNRARAMLLSCLNEGE